VGELLDALESTGMHRDTVVMLTADHGEMAGERGLWYKMSFFEGSVRVPLIVRGPGIARGRAAGAVSHLDLAPTLAELAAAPVGEAGLEGRSLVPTLCGAGPCPDGAESEYLAEGVAAPAVMIRRGRYKYIRCGGDPDQLYDLDADPRELVNLAGAPAHADACERLRAESDERWDLAGIERRVLRSQRDRRLVAPALATGAHTPWDFQPHTDASRQYVRGPAAAHPRPGAPLLPGALPGDSGAAPPE
jgi:choline-sulfatase